MNEQAERTRTAEGCMCLVAAMFDRTVRDVSQNLSDKDDALSFIHSDARLGEWAELLGMEINSVRKGLLDRIKKESVAASPFIRERNDRARTASKLIEWQGKTDTIEGWAESLGLCYPGFYHRVRHWGLCDRTFTPKGGVRHSKKRKFLPCGTVVITDGNEEKAVKIIFKARSVGSTYKDIADKLNAKGLKTGYGNKFSKQSVNNLAKRFGIK